MNPPSKLRHFGKSERIVLLVLLLLGIVLILLSLLPVSSSPAAGSPMPPAQPTSLHGKQSDSLYTSPKYVGPPERSGYAGVQKFARKQTLDLNRVDSLTLLRVPGIGPTFAKRIIALRSRLGGYYTVLQLQEVYGMNEDRFLELRSWFRVMTAPHRYQLSALQLDSLPEHPYLSYRHKRALRRILARHGRLHSWQTLMRQPEFTRDDSIRLSPYFVEAIQPDSLRTQPTNEP